MIRPAFLMSAALLLGSAASLAACQPPRAGDPSPSTSERRDAAASEPSRDSGSARRDMATSGEPRDGASDAPSGPDTASSPDTGKTDATTADAAGSADAASADATAPADTAPLPATWDTVWKTLQTHCNSCHENAGNEFLINKDKAMFHRYLTMTNAHHCKNGTTELKYVQPSDPLKSVIYLAMSDMKCAGPLPAKKMPPEGAESYPSQAEIKAVEAWIKAGAKAN